MFVFSLHVKRKMLEFCDYRVFARIQQVLPSVETVLPWFITYQLNQGFLMSYGAVLVMFGTIYIYEHNRWTTFPTPYKVVAINGGSTSYIRNFLILCENGCTYDINVGPNIIKKRTYPIIRTFAVEVGAHKCWKDFRTLNKVSISDKAIGLDGQLYTVNGVLLLKPLPEFALQLVGTWLLGESGYWYRTNETFAGKWKRTDLSD